MVFYLTISFVFFSFFGKGRSASPIEAVNINRARRSSEITTTATKTTTCCNCFGPLKNQWDDAISNQMSEVYCRTCEDDICDCENGELVYIPDSPAILRNVTQQKDQRTKYGVHPKKLCSIVKIDSEFEISTASVSTENGPKNLSNVKKDGIDEYELGGDVVSLKAFSRRASTEIDTKKLIRVRGKEELPVASEVLSVGENQLENHKQSSKFSDESRKIDDQPNSKTLSKRIPNKVLCANDHPLKSNETETSDNSERPKTKTGSRDWNGNRSLITSTSTSASTFKNDSMFKSMNRMYSTLPKMKKITTFENSANRPPFSIPKKVTSDGTTLYYLCDLPKHLIKGALNSNRIYYVISLTGGFD